MRAVTTVGPRRVRIEDAPDPADTELLDGLAVVAVRAVGLCGTDLHIWEGSYPAGQLPIVQGHEIVGRVVALAPGLPTALRPGSSVVVDPAVSCGVCHACRVGRANACAAMSVMGVHAGGGLCSRVVIPVQRLHRIDESAAALGVLVEPAAISLQAVARSRAATGESAVVLGCGPIGLLAVLALCERGVDVAAVDVHPARLALAARFGARLCLPAPERRIPIDRLRTWARNEGPAIVIEATGSPEALSVAVDLVAAAGRVVAVGISGAAVTLPMLTLPYKELDLLGSRNSTGLFPTAVDFVVRNAPSVAALITHRFALEESTTAFEALADPDSQVCKAVIELS